LHDKADNVVARNQDDHTRNIAFLMDRQGKWSLAPAFDIVWAFNPLGNWTNRHQMSINGKRDNFSLSDMSEVAGLFGIKNPTEIIEYVCDAVSQWPGFAQKAGVADEMCKAISKTHRIDLISRVS
jgi:serine/threonine-protein kinase HipA